MDQLQASGNPAAAIAGARISALAKSPRPGSAPWSLISAAPAAWSRWTTNYHPEARVRRQSPVLAVGLTGRFSCIALGFLY